MSRQHRRPGGPQRSSRHANRTHGARSQPLPIHINDKQLSLIRDSCDTQEGRPLRPEESERFVYHLRHSGAIREALGRACRDILNSYLARVIAIDNPDDPYSTAALVWFYDNDMGLIEDVEAPELANLTQESVFRSELKKCLSKALKPLNRFEKSVSLYPVPCPCSIAILARIFE